MLIKYHTLITATKNKINNKINKRIKSNYLIKYQLNIIMQEIFGDLKDKVTNGI